MKQKAKGAEEDWVLLKREVKNKREAQQRKKAKVRLRRRARRTQK